eukprot:7367315-Alexandrium_andersonii.AAC.1
MPARGELSLTTLPVALTNAEQSQTWRASGRSRVSARCSPRRPPRGRTGSSQSSTTPTLWTSTPLAGY